MCLLVIEAKGVFADGDGDILAFARLQIHFTEAFQLLYRTVYTGLVIMYVELYNLSACHSPGVSDVHRNLKAVVSGDAACRETQVGEPEGGVAHTMTEGEESLGMMRISPAITHIHAFLILLVNSVIEISIKSAFSFIGLRQVPG